MHTCLSNLLSTHSSDLQHTFVGTRRPLQGRGGRARASATLPALSCTDPPPPQGSPSWPLTVPAGPGPPDSTGPSREPAEASTPLRRTCDATAHAASQASGLPGDGVSRVFRLNAAELATPPRGVTTGASLPKKITILKDARDRDLTGTVCTVVVAPQSRHVQHAAYVTQQMFGRVDYKLNTGGGAS